MDKLPDTQSSHSREVCMHIGNKRQTPKYREDTEASHEENSRKGQNKET